MLLFVGSNPTLLITGPCGETADAADSKSASRKGVEVQVLSGAFMMISTGQICKSKSGRELSPAPKIDCTSDRKILNTQKRIYEWLKKEAMKELEGNEFAFRMIGCIDINNISPSDVETLNDVLFGE